MWCSQGTKLDTYRILAVQVVYLSALPKHGPLEVFHIQKLVCTRLTVSPSFSLPSNAACSKWTSLTTLCNVTATFLQVT